MENLLRFEFRKLFRQKKIYVCCLVICLFVYMTAAMMNLQMEDWVYGLYDEISGIDGLVTTINDGSFILISGIFAVLVITEDYGSQTIKNIYARGFSRGKVFCAKVIAILTGVTTMFAVSLLFSFCINTAYFGAGEVDLPKLLSLLGSQYVVCLANAMLSTLIGILFRKNGLAITGTIIFPGLVTLLLLLADLILDMEKVFLTEYWVAYLPTDILYLDVTNGRMMECAVAAVIYIAVFYLLGLGISKKIEL